MRSAIRAFLRRHELRLDRWYVAWGSWWMVQACPDGWLSLGVHVDPRCRTEALTGNRFGPYVDFHLGCVIVSLGRNPFYSARWHQYASFGRGGIPEGEPWPQ